MPKVHKKGHVCVDHTSYKKGICDICRYCRKCPPSPTCSNPKNHSCGKSRGYPSSAERMLLQAPPMDNNSGSSSINIRSSSHNIHGEEIPRIGGLLVEENTDQNIQHMHESMVQVELFPTQSKKQTLQQIMTLLNIPLLLVHKIPSDGIKSIRGDGRELRRAVSVLRSIIDALSMLLLKEEGECILLQNEMSCKTNENNIQIPNHSIYKTLIDLSFFGKKNHDKGIQGTKRW